MILSLRANARVNHGSVPTVSGCLKQFRKPRISVGSLCPLSGSGSSVKISGVDSASIFGVAMTNPAKASPLPKPPDYHALELSKPLKPPYPISIHAPVNANLIRSTNYIGSALVSPVMSTDGHEGGVKIGLNPIPQFGSLWAPRFSPPYSPQPYPQPVLALWFYSLSYHTSSHLHQHRVLTPFSPLGRELQESTLSQTNLSRSEPNRT